MNVIVIAISVGIFLWTYLASVILTAYVASEKGRSGLGWFFLSLVFPPYMSLLALSALPDYEEDAWETRTRRGPVPPTFGQRLGRS